MKRASLLFALVAFSQVGATDCGQVIRDPGFDIWCGDSLCSWKLLRGDIEQVGTWTEGDSGVSFVGDDTAIQQVAPVNSTDGQCIRFSMIADVEENAEVFLDIDVEADGVVERSERVGTTHWQKVTFLINVAPPYDGIRFELAKHGPGRAVLANIGAELSTECTGIPPIETAARPLGASCSDTVACDSDICIPSETTFPAASLFACAGCDPSLGAAACTGGMVCGVSDPLSPVLAVPVSCIPPASRELSEQCISDAECASGMCARGETGPGVCSSCKTSADCGGAACAAAWLAGSRGPNVCAPGAGTGITGSGCGTDDDCASGTCNGGPAHACDLDGRPCVNDFSCPAGTDLIPGTCNTVGVQGGVCS
jgi:hypothetical protein